MRAYYAGKVPSPSTQLADANFINVHHSATQPSANYRQTTRQGLHENESAPTIRLEFPEQVLMRFENDAFAAYTPRDWPAQEVVRPFGGMPPSPAPRGAVAGEIRLAASGDRRRGDPSPEEPRSSPGRWRAACLGGPAPLSRGTFFKRYLISGKNVCALHLTSLQQPLKSERHITISREPRGTRA